MTIPRGLLLALLLTCMLTPVAQAANSHQPDAVVRALYQSAMKHFGFSPESIKAAKPWLTPALYDRLWKKVNAPTPKGDAPDIEGDVFLNSQEQPDGFVVGNTSADPAAAQVEVTLTWGGASGEKRRYFAHLRQIDGAWKVEDIDYGKDGKLSDLLK